MRVLITTDSYYPQVNGASYFAQRLAANLTERLHQVLVTAPSMSFHAGHFAVAGVDVYGFRSVPVFFYKDMRIALPVDLDRTAAAVLRGFRPDVVHAQGHFPISQAMIQNAKLLGIPVVGTNHFMPENLTHYAHLPASLDARLRRRLWRKFRRVYEDLDQVTTPTRTAAEYMKRNGFSREIKVISNGIDLERFVPARATTSSGAPTVSLRCHCCCTWEGWTRRRTSTSFCERWGGFLPGSLCTSLSLGPALSESGWNGRQANLAWTDG